MKNVAIAAAVSLFTQATILTPANAGQTSAFDAQLQLAQSRTTGPGVRMLDPANKSESQGWQVAGRGGLCYISSC